MRAKAKAFSISNGYPSGTIGVCANVTNRLADITGGENPHTYLGDSWFGSVISAVLMGKKGHHFTIGRVKTAHAPFPKDFLEKEMKGMPAGSRIT